MAIAQGSAMPTRYLTVPLRRESTAVYDVLARIAAESPFARDPQDRPRLVKEIQETFRDFDVGLEIH